MASPELHILVLAGGESTRVKTGTPKALLDLCGQPLLGHILDVAGNLTAQSHTLVLGPTHQAPIEAWMQKAGYEAWKVVIQPEAKGTGDAVRCALASLPATGKLLILCGDTPLLETETLAFLAEQEGGALLTCLVDNPTGYGRILREEESGALLKIVEEDDADEEIRKVCEINAGVYFLDLEALHGAIAHLDTQNAQGELYLTDAAVAILSDSDGTVVCLEDGEDEIQGVNDLVDFAEVVASKRQNILEQHLLAGVIVVDPVTTFIETGVTIGAGTTIHPFSVLRAGVKVGRGCSVGPFSHLRPGTELSDGAEVGNFVETKNAKLGLGAKAKHLSYLGDAIIGQKANIGCGTITANYDGKNKHQTIIGDRAFIGSGTVLVAPVKVGIGSITGAGAIVPKGKDVADGQTVVGVPARPHPKQNG
jgi:bifunctional UDP-N-acetylglucosamine pyrophosphorylase/glucosamine-1-phosphate N-acetyltransferase